MENEGDEIDKCDKEDGRGEDRVAETLDWFEVDERGESTIAGALEQRESVVAKPQKPDGREGLM